MVSSTGRNQPTMEAWPFPMLGEHFVYAKVGEVIAIGSSVMGYGNGGVRVTGPNGDGVNDYFVIPGSERFERMELSIFNRWGNEVYRSSNYDNDWAGLNLHEGVYYYQLRAYESGRLVYQDGWVLLRRNL